MRLVRRLPVVVLGFVLLTSCSGGDGGSAFPSVTGSTVSSTSAATSTSSTATTTTSLEESVGVVRAVFPEAGSLIVSAEFGIVPTNIISIALEEGSRPRDADAVAAAVGGTVVGRLEAVDFYQIRFEGSTEADLLAALDTAEAQPGVALAVADTAEYLQSGTCESHSVLDEGSSYVEGRNARPMEMIGVEEAWDIIAASGVEMHGAQVGVIDTKLSSFSSEISGATPITGATDDDYTADPKLDEDGNVADGGLTHGTQTSQVIAADPDNGGVTGVAAVPGADIEVTVSGVLGGPDVVEIPQEDRELVASYEQDGKAFTFSTMAAMLTQIRNGATVINMSFGAKNPDDQNQWTYGMYKVFFERIYARYPGVVFVAAAGNAKGGLNGQNYFPGGIPAPNLITVGGVNNQGKRANFSNFAAPGGEVTIAAPAVGIPVGVGSDGNTVLNDGTSFAAPMVSGAAALLKSINPALTAEQIKQILVETASPGPADVGGGVLRVDDAALRVINDLREDANPPQQPLEKDALLTLTSIHGEITQTGPLDFNITASVEAVPEGGTSLTISLAGQGTIGGDSPVAVQSLRRANWTLTLPQEGATAAVTVCRTDSDACCNLTPQPPTIDGHYTGTLTIQSDEDPTEAMSLVGVTMDLEVDLTTDASGGGVADVTVIAPWGSGTLTEPLTWNGNRVQFGEEVLGFSGTVAVTGDTVKITGTFTGEGYVGDTAFPIAGIFELTKVD
jgi:hypothetical protein